MNHHLVPRLALALTSSILMACGDRTDTTPLAPEDSPVLMREAVTPVASTDPLDALAEAVEGFAGFYLEGTSVVVVLTDVGRAEAARPFVRTVVAALPSDLVGQVGDNPEIVVRPGEYAFADLKAWREQVGAPFFAIDGAVSLSISQTRNRVRLGVSTREAEDAVKEMLAETGVPSGAVMVEVERFEPHSCATLRDYCRPIEGGLILPRDGDSHGLGCTLGFNAIRNNQEVFLTVAHCSPRMFRTDYNSYYQHVAIADATHYIGQEYFDPPGFSCLWYAFWKECRYSDAAIVLTGPSVQIQRGFIARTLGPDLGTNSRVINTANP